MEFLVVAIILVLFAILRSRLSVENPGNRKRSSHLARRENRRHLAATPVPPSPQQFRPAGLPNIELLPLRPARSPSRNSHCRFFDYRNLFWMRWLADRRVLPEKVSIGAVLHPPPWLLVQRSRYSPPQAPANSKRARSNPMQEVNTCEPVGLKPSANERSQVRAAIKALYRKGDTIEVRAWDKDHHIYTGRYKYGTKLVEIIELFDAEGCDVYTVLNPVGTKLGLRDMSVGGLCTWEQDVPWRRSFLLDFDPKRSSKIATEEQFQAALAAAKAAKAWLEGMGWTGIVLASSGNGAHLDIPCDLPNDMASKEMVRKVQRVVSGKFSTPAVEAECFPDANRLVRAYGTVNKKGEETETLKHRLSGVLEADSTGACNPREIMDRILRENPVADVAVKTHATGEGKGPFTREVLGDRLQAWKENWGGPEGEEFGYEDCDRLDGFRIWCPGNFPDGWLDGEAHGDVYDSLNDSTIVWVENGWPRFSCRHAHCGEGAEHGKKTWLDLQNYYDPERRLHRILDETDFPEQWNVESVVNGSGGVGEAGAEEILADPIAAMPPRREAMAEEAGAEAEDTTVAAEEARRPATRPQGEVPKCKKPYAMPESAMYGWLGKKARELQTPLGFAYPAMLTAFAALLKASPKQVRPTLYTSLTGPVHCGKTETIKRALASLDFPDPETVRWTVPGSDRGLINIFGGKKKPHKEEAFGLEVAKARLLAQDELRNALAKADISGSSLPSTLCSLWSQDEAGAADKTGEHVALVRLNILGALKADDPEEFSEVFGKQSTSGLYDRFVYGIAPNGWKYNLWEPNKENRCASNPDITPLCFRLLGEWRDESPEARGRLGEIALRVAYISAAANQDEEVSEECMRAALEFAAWQEAIRSGYRAGLGEGVDALATNAILNVLEKVEGKWIVWREVAQKKNWYRKFGAAALSRVRDSLAKSGMTVEEAEEDEKGRPRRTGRLRLRKAEDEG